MNIAICEDAASDLRHMQGLVEKIIDEMDIDASLSTYGSGEELLSELAAGFVPAVCFLDIYMGGISGVELAREIKSKHPGCVIIFSTSSSDHMADGFDIGAAHYILKPVSRESVEAALRRAVGIVGYEARFVELIVNRRPRRVLLSDIIYAEIQPKSCNIYLKSTSEPLRVYLKLDELEKMLSDRRFLRCHHSYIVNLEAVTAPTEDCCFLLNNGIKVPIRQRSRKEIISAYNDYYFERMRRDGL